MKTATKSSRNIWSRIPRDARVIVGVSVVSSVIAVMLVVAVLPV